MSRRRVVSSFEALLQPFSGGVNAVCFERTLVGDFEGIATAFADDELVNVDQAMLREAKNVDARAVRVLLEDLERLTSLGREPQLNVITRYPRDERGLPISVDVHSFHVDRAPIEADTFLCTYAGASSEGLDNDDAVRLVDVPEVVDALRGFDVVEEHFDLHYRMKPGATPYSFGTGHLWRLSCDWPGSPVLPCIHRAPEHDGRPRLLLIA
ncbi:MAG: hypothetical protein ACO1OB_05430 [Archangium sp.]